jgi:hypothetical protein
MRIRVHIERLVLEGFRQRMDPHRLGVALERELARTLSDLSPAGWRGGAVDSISVPGPAVSATERPEGLARAITHATRSGIAAAQAGETHSAFGKTSGDPP